MDGVFDLFHVGHLAAIAQCTSRWGIVLTRECYKSNILQNAFNHNLGSFIWSLCNFDFLLGERSEKAQEMHQHNVFYTNYNTIVSLTYTRCTPSLSAPRSTPRWLAIAV